MLFWRAFRQKYRREELPEGWIVAAPPERQAVDEEACLLQLFLALRPHQATAREPAVQHHARNALGVFGCVRDRDRASLRQSQDRKAFELELINKCLEIPHPGIE